MLTRHAKAVLLLCCASCGLPVFPASAQDSQVRSASAPMVVLWAHARPARDGLAVNGFVRRTTGRPGPLPGYIRIAAPRAGGTGEVVACLRSRDLRLAGSRGGTFQVRLAGAAEPERIIAVYADTCP